MSDAVREDATAPVTLPFPSLADLKPTEFFNLNIPPSSDDTLIRIEYFRSKDACQAATLHGQQLYVAPDGSAFVFKVSTRPASASTTFGVRTVR